MVPGHLLVPDPVAVFHPPVLAVVVPLVRHGDGHVVGRVVLAVRAGGDQLVLVPLRVAGAVVRLLVALEQFQRPAPGIVQPQRLVEP